MSLLTIVQNVSRRVNYGAAVTTAFSATDPSVQLMVDCAQDAGDDAYERVDWAALKKQAPQSFTGNGTTPAFTVPEDWGRLSPSDTFISSLFPTLRMPGPVMESDLLAMKALPVVAQPSVWRQVIYNGAMSIEFFPVLALNEVVTYYSAGSAWILQASGAPRIPTQWGADTDVSVIPERVITFGAIWRWKKSKGLDYAEAKDEAEAILDRLQAQEKTLGPIHMSRMFTVDNSTWFPGTITSLLDDNG